MNKYTNAIQSGTGQWMQHLRAEISAFHNEEEGVTTMEVLMILFIAGVAIYALSEMGTSIFDKISEAVANLLKFKPSWSG